MQKALKIVPFGIVIFFAVGVSLYAFSYLFIHHPFLDSKGPLLEQTTWPVAFHMHFLGGGVALLIGWMQFWKKLRHKYLRWHRITGSIYIISVLLVGGLGGLYVAVYANGGFANQLGFGCMAVSWLYTTFRAYSAIRKRDIQTHMQWMIRSYALTFAAPTLRIWMPLFIWGLGIAPPEAYAAVAWFCWVPNLVVAEWIINKELVKF